MAAALEHDEVGRIRLISDADLGGPGRCGGLLNNLFVTGCGRSGTSMLTGLFRPAGYFMGERLYAPRPSNPKGFFEDADVNAINERMLERLLPARRLEGGVGYGADSPGRGQRWLARLPLDAEITSEPDEEEAIRGLVARAPFCFKDPRFCYTLGAWRSAAPEARMICIFRRPGVVVSSILQEIRASAYLRDFALSLDQAFEVWRRMYEFVLRRQSAQGEWLFVCYDDVVSGAALDRLEAFAGAPVDRSFATAQLDRSREEVQPDPASSRLFDELKERAC